MSAPAPLKLPFLVVVSLLLSIATGFAYEKDIHYSATLAIAIAAGWPLDDARVIAGAAQGVDENRSTIAALEFDVIESQPKTINGELVYLRGPIHQAPKNFRYHCFSEVSDQPSRIEAGVAKTREARMDDAARTVISDAQVAPPRQSLISSLVAIGVAVHCIQDSYSHNSYGGRCPKVKSETYPGNCYGHTKDSIKDQFFQKFGRTNPDNPAVRNVNDLISALDATRIYLRDARKLVLAKQAGAPAGGGPLAPKDLDQLAQALHNPATKKLDDEVRMACNHEIIAGWLYTVLPGHGARMGPLLTTAPAAKECMSAFGSAFPPHRLDLGSALYPRLSANAAPARTGKLPPYSTTNAPFDMVGAKDIADLKVEEVTHQQHSCTASECTYSFTVRVSNIGQAKSAAGYLLFAVVPIDDHRESFGFKAKLDSIPEGKSAEVRASTAGPANKDYFVNVDIQPGPHAESDWRDANVHNDSASCAVFDGRLAEKPDSHSGAKCHGIERPPG